MKKTATIILSLMAAGCFHDSPDESGETNATVSGATIVAEVNGVPVSELRISIYTPAAAGADRQTILDNIISSELIAQAARKAGMDSRPEIAEQLQIAEQTVLGRAYTLDFIENNPVSEDDVAQRYEEMKSEIADTNEYRTAHILVEDESLAKDLYAQVAEDGAQFAELAKQHSLDTGSAANGGELGWTDPRALVPEYSDAMQNTAPGELAAAPVRTQFGWHIIRVDEKRPITPPTLNDELRHNLEQSIRAEMFSVHLKTLRDNADIVIK